MNTPQISCYLPEAKMQPFTFYVLAHGPNAGQPSLTPWEKCYAVHCPNQERFDFYFWMALTLHQMGQLKTCQQARGKKQ